MKSAARLSLACLAGSLLGACHVQPGAPRPLEERAGDGRAGVEFPLQPDLSVSRAPHEGIEVNWKQRLDEPYVFLEARGSYTGIGALLEETHRELLAAGLEVVGPPFALFYDDPGLVPAEELRMRACFPVRGAGQAAPPLGSALLPSTTVAYAFVAGPYPEIPLAYPGLFAYLERLGWALDGPVREIYLVNPATVADWNELVAEVQLPATSAR